METFCELKSSFKSFICQGREGIYHSVLCEEILCILMEGTQIEIPSFSDVL